MSLLDLVEEIVKRLDRYSIQECLQDIGKNVLSFLNAETCLFYLLDTHQNDLYIAQAVGRPALKDEKYRLPMGKGIAGYVAKNRESVFFNDLQESGECISKLNGLNAGSAKYFPERGSGCRAVIALPLIAFGTLIGVVEAIDPGSRVFTEDDVEMLQPLINIAALAIPRNFSDDSFAKLAEICVRFLEEKDPYTHGHSLRVMRYSMLLADELQLPDQEKDELKLCSLLHDIGKVILKDSILAKKGRLTRSEFDTVKMHPAIGSNITGKISKSLAAKIQAHHEKFDGTGYPNGLMGRQIPMISRIIAVADTFDAITSTRPYRDQGTVDNAMVEIHRWSGMQFDPVLVSAFRRLFKRGEVKVEQI